MILNLTQHAASPEQIAAGVVDMPEHIRAQLSVLLTFEDLPSPEIIQERAVGIANICDVHYADSAMIGGAPFLMGALIAELRDMDIKPLFAFSRRESVEAAQEDGSVRKTAVFRHCGWIPA